MTPKYKVNDIVNVGGYPRKAMYSRGFVTMVCENYNADTGKPEVGVHWYEINGMDSQPESNLNLFCASEDRHLIGTLKENSVIKNRKKILPGEDDYQCS